LRAVVIDRAGGVEGPQHEENVGLIKERERELAPEKTWSGVGRIAATLDLV
jgi:hypothetical protein